MKVKYLQYREPEWIRILLKDVEIGEVFRDLHLPKDHRPGSWWREWWRKDKDFLTPLHERNTQAWTGYNYPATYFRGATVLVER